MRKLLEWIALKLPIRPIYHEDGLYLKRYYICTLFGYWRVYLHHFMLDDPDGLHNHPFKYSFSIILAGWYYEKRRWGRRKVRWFNFLPGDTLHKVLLPERWVPFEGIQLKTCWSLFVHSPRVCDWAFIRPIKDYIHLGQVSFSYENVREGVAPTPLSDWHKTAPTGAEWELKQQHERESKYDPVNTF